MTKTLPEAYSELGLEVPIAQIDHELRKLWEQDDARTNASLMNLVIYSEKEGSLLDNSRIINDLTRENACRAILVEINREEEASLRAWITAHCHLSSGRKSVCCEQIAFRLTGTVTGRFRNTVFSHLNSDLPLVFWWQGELSHVFTERLASVMDRLIVDTSSWKDVKGSFERIMEAEERNPTIVIQDLAWTRSWQFRVGIASLFDDSVAQGILDDIEKIRIKHAPEDKNTALLVLSWLAVQAGWEHVGDCQFRMKQSDGIQVEIIADEDSAPLGLVELIAGNTVVRVSCEKGAAHVKKEIVSDSYNVSSFSPADPLECEELVAHQLARGGKDSLYRKVLPQFLELV